METLKDNFNNLVLKTLEMDQIETREYLTTLQSQPMYKSKNEVESQQDQTEKKKIPQRVMLSVDIESSILPLELNVRQLELNLETFCRIFHVRVLIKKTFIMEILS